MSNCEPSPCPNYACNFVATRNSPTSIAQCNTDWHFSSNCIRSKESAQVDMTLMYYLQSQAIVAYQIQAICLTNNCNNFTTFLQLKDAITVDPDLSCLVNDTFSTTTKTTSSKPTTTTTTTTTTSKSPGTSEGCLIKTNLFINIILLIHLTIKY